MCSTRARSGGWTVRGRRGGRALAAAAVAGLLGACSLPGAGSPPVSAPAPERAQTAAQQVDPDTVLWIQRRLRELGYHTGPVDGVPGPSTRSAIRSYQRDQGLEPDGSPSEQLKDFIWRNGG